MLAFLKKLFGIEQHDFKKMVAEGALILDVRTPKEFATGHIENSKNISIQKLKNKLSKLSKDRIIITVCASGMRSGSAKIVLNNNGFTAYNGGAWTQLKKQLEH